MKWHKLSEEPIPKILYRSGSAVVIKRKDGTQDTVYPNKDGYITLSFICNEPSVMYSPDLNGIQYWASIDELVIDSLQPDSMKEVLDFIRRRFRDYDCNWTNGNCYYFAVILAERFRDEGATIYYDTVDGHFICKIDDVFYDWNGALTFEDEYIEKYIMKWSDLCDKDPLWRDRIIRDVIK